MLVPSRSRTARSDARLLSEIARTATIAAMPMAMPTAVSDDRSLRDAQATSGDPRDPDRPGAARVGDGSAARPPAASPRPSPRPVAAGTTPVVRPSAVIRPSCSSTRRGSEAARSRSCVITAIVAPSVALRSRIRSTSAAPVTESRFPVGSSARMIAGRPTRARAMATRWRSPPESWPGRWRARSARPTRSSAASAASAAVASPARRGRGGRRPRCRAPTPRRAGGSAGRRSRSATRAARRAAGPTGGRRARRPRGPRPPSPGPGCR